ncbi:MAG: hypothetical protein EOP48_09180 [Sphingobacteriales bacterium]|nr:MAG: hypothetical protein EOP48_09180 [Sphingobacteriales bacterium]
MKSSSNRNVITIATGKRVYVDMAATLARSFLWWHKDSDIRFYLVTDNESFIPADIKDKVELLLVNPGELGEGFSTKLYLDKLAPEGRTLFIDSDCMIFGDISPIFTAFEGKDVSVVGNYISKGEWFGDIGKICKDFGLKKIPKFNGGIYYIEKGDLAARVYEKARELEKKYDEIGFLRLRGKPNDEVLMAVSMELNRMTPVIDDGTIMSDPQACQGGYKIKVLTGERWLYNPPAPNKLHQDWYPFELVKPLIVHFLGSYTEHYPYRSEQAKLKYALSDQLNVVAEFLIKLKIVYPEKLKLGFKDAFRPLYHKLLGHNSIKRSPRI